MKIGDYKQMMAYLTRPEQPKEQFASAEVDALKEELNEKLGPGVIKTLDELPPVQNPFKDFEDRNPRENAAEGGRANLAIGGGAIEGEDLGTREGFADPDIIYPFKRPGGAPDYRFGFNKKTGKYFRKIGKGDNIRTIIQEEGESLEDFKNRKPERVEYGGGKTTQARTYINNWTKNWLDNNLTKYDLQDFNTMLQELSTDWQQEVESGKVPKGTENFNLTTPEFKLPNITTGADAKIKKDVVPFKYNDIEFYKNLEGTSEQQNKTLAQWKKVFYKNKIESDPELKQGLKKFFDFMSADKRGLYKTLSGQTIKQFIDTQVNDDVKFLLNTQASGLDKASKNEVFNSFEDLSKNYNIFTKDKARLKAVEDITVAKQKAGPKTSAQTNQIINQIKQHEKIIANTPVEELAKNKTLLNSVRLVINPNTGQVSYTNYTDKDPKGKPAKTDLELAEYIKQKAAKGQFLNYDHITQRRTRQMNVQFPVNIQEANYMSNAQLENARRYLKNNPDTANAKTIDSALDDIGLTVRGKDYDKTFGYKEPIVFDSKTGTSNIVDNSFKKIIGKSGKIGAAAALATLAGTGFSMADEVLPSEGSALLPGAAAAGTAGAGYALRKPLTKFGKYALQVAGTPLGATGLIAGFGVDPKSAMDRVGIEAELALAPELVKQSAKFSPAIQKILNFGLSPAMAARAARIASPLGIASLGGEALYKYGKFVKDELGRIEQMSPEEREAYNIAEQEQMGVAAADGGLIRRGFADGPPDPSKRKFMKIMGGLTSLPILGKFFDVAQVAEKAAPAVVETFKNAPPHFIGLVNKIRALGKIVDPKKLLRSEQDRYSNVYDYGEYRMFERPDGQVEIQKQKLMATDYGDGILSEEYMSYDPKRPKFNKKGEKIEGEYDEVYEENTTYADQYGEMQDVREGVEPETINDGTFSKEELEQLIIEQIEDSIKKGKK